jgi:hypothetical protein
VLSTVADAVSGGELNQILSRLPAGYAALSGKPALAWAPGRVRASRDTSRTAGYEMTDRIG